MAENFIINIKGDSMRKFIPFLIIILLLFAAPVFAWSTMGWDKGRTIPKKNDSGTSYTIGTGGDFTTWAACRAALPEVLTGDVTITLLQGTTLNEQIELKGLMAFENDLTFTITTTGYYPTTTGTIQTATAASATSLTDSGVGWTADAYINSWVLIVDGTGTDNGFVQITDNTTEQLTVASWPGTQPDATSKYLIVGALLDGTHGDHLLNIRLTNMDIAIRGIGLKDAATNRAGAHVTDTRYISFYDCGFYNNGLSGISASVATYLTYACGFVGNNTDANSVYGGIRSVFSHATITVCYFSDNSVCGIYGTLNGAVVSVGNGGDNNGTYGMLLYAGAVTAGGAITFSGSSGSLYQQINSNELVTDFIPISYCTDGATAPAALEAITLGSRKYDIRYFASDQTEDVECFWSVPFDLDTTVSVQYQVIAIVNAADPAANEGISFDFAGVSLGTDDGGAATVGSAAESEIADLGDYAQNDLVITPWTTVTITNLAANEMAIFNLARDHDDTVDDWGQDLAVVGFRLKYGKAGYYAY